MSTTQRSMHRSLTGPSAAARPSSPCALASLAAIVAMLLAACASTPPPEQTPFQQRSEFDRSLDSWNGAPLSELLKKLGKPTAVTHRAGNNSIYAFTKSTPKDPQTGLPHFSCTVRYVVDDKAQQVRSHQIEGC